MLKNILASRIRRRTWSQKTLLRCFKIFFFILQNVLISVCSPLKLVTEKVIFKNILTFLAPPKVGKEKVRRNFRHVSRELDAETNAWHRSSLRSDECLASLLSPLYLRILQSTETFFCQPYIRYGSL